MIITREITNVIMTKIEEDYVSFETAKLLKEKGFHEVCKCQYGRHGDIGWTSSNNGNVTTFARPTLQMVMKWLRENFGYNILIIADGDLGNLHYLYEIQEIDNELLQANGSLDIEDQRFDTYEEACEAAIKYCLKHLI